MAAYGSGAVARSIRDACRVMNVDVGGGTSKIAVCAEGKVVDLCALDVGARLVCLAPDGRIVRVEPAGRAIRRRTRLGTASRRHAHARTGRAHWPVQWRASCSRRWRGGVADRGGRPRCCAPSRLRRGARIDELQFSGGVSEFIYGNELGKFGDLGPLLAAEIQARAASMDARLEQSVEGIRATVVGASQYTVQLSGSTIYVNPLNALPLRNVPVMAPDLPLEQEMLDPAAVANTVANALKQLDLGGEQPVALFVPWRGSATYQRLDAFCRGAVLGLARVLERGHPLVLAGDGDVGGLLGIHLHEEMKLASPVISIDGLELKEFDYIDIGAMLDSSGAVPVVIKSLIFPAAADARRPAEWAPATA